LVTPFPFVPLPFIKGNGDWLYKRGFASLCLSFSIFLLKGGGRILKRGSRPPLKFPKCLVRIVHRHTI